MIKSEIIYIDDLWSYGGTFALSHHPIVILSLSHPGLSPKYAAANAALSEAETTPRSARSLTDPQRSLRDNIFHLQDQVSAVVWLYRLPLPNHKEFRSPELGHSTLTKCC